MSKSKTPDDSTLNLAKDAFRRGRYLDAQALVAPFAPPEEWEGAEVRVWGGRLLLALGAANRANRVFRAAWRDAPDSSLAFYYHVLNVVGRQGSFETLRRVHERLGGIEPERDPESMPEAHLYLLKGRLLSHFRDFSSSARWLEAGLRFAPEDAWAHLEHAFALEAEDRYAEALEAAEWARTLRGNYRPVYEYLGHLLLLLNREKEALHLVREGAEQMQAGSLWSQLAGLQIECEDWDGAEESLEKARICLPLAEEGWERVLQARRAEVAYRRGRFADARVAAEKVRGDYYKNMARRLEGAEENGRPDRLTLPVGFVRQHHMTCAPATLSAVSAYLGKPIDHLALASVITYDGTPDHEERNWLEGQGWWVREFRLTWDTAVALLDRGIPFTLVVNWVRQAHLQAVIGYDRTLGTLVIRDPYYRSNMEVLAEEFLKEQEPFGPRAMVLLPPERAEEVADVNFPDAPVYDLYYRFRRSLVAYDRAAAGALLGQMKELAPGHNLELYAEQELAGFDGDMIRGHALLEERNRRFPEEQNTQLNLLGSLRYLGHIAERNALLEKCALGPKQHPIFWQTYVEVLREDNRQQRRAWRRAWRLLRVGPTDAANLSTMANLLWDAGRFAEASLLYRLAASAGETVEQHWQSFFIACRYLNQTGRALDLLRERFSRLKGKSGNPALTLESALGQAGEPREGLRVLEEAVAARPKDGALLLGLGDARARVGDFRGAEECLARAEGLATPVDWLRTAERIETWRGGNRAALAHAKAFLEKSPLDTEMLAEHMRLTVWTEGRAEALAWLEDYVSRYPHFIPLRRIWLEHLREEEPEKALAAVEEMLAALPMDAWALREKVLILRRAKRSAEAKEIALLAESVEPVAESAGLVGLVALDLLDYAGARDAFRRGLKRSIDAGWMYARLLEACETFEERRAEIAFVAEELRTQASLGQGYLTFVENAAGLLEPDRLLEALNSFVTERPMHWQAHSARIRASLAQGTEAQAKVWAEEALERFPLHASLWLDLADVQRAGNDPVAEAAALLKGLEIAPSWSALRQRLAALYERERRLDEAQAVLDDELVLNPLNTMAMVMLAQLDWQRGRTEAAVEKIRRAIELEPENGRAWDLLEDWTRGTETVLQQARELAERAPFHDGVQMRLALELAIFGNGDEALAVLERLLEKSPAHLGAHDLRVRILAEFSRYEEALAAARPEVFAGAPPLGLQGRAAWVRWRRGDYAAAIKEMEEVLRRHPDYAWGWQMLASWQLAQQNTKRAAEAAARYACLQPDDPSSLCYTASVLLETGKKADAVPYLEKALRLDSSNLYASANLFKLALARKDFVEARRKLEVFRAHGSPWEALACEVELCAAQKDVAGAEECFRRLLIAPPGETQHVQRAVKCLNEEVPGKLVRAVCFDLLGSPEANPVVGALWAESFTLRGKPIRTRLLRKAKAREEARRKAYVVYLGWMGEAEKNRKVLWELLWHGRWLRSNAETWGAVGYVLLGGSFWYAWIFRWWMRGWKEKGEQVPWALWNIVAYEVTRRRLDTAAEVSRWMVEQQPGNPYVLHVSYLACWHALRGRTEESEAMLAIAAVAEEEPMAYMMQTFAREMNAVARNPKEKRRERLKLARWNVHKLEGKFPSAWKIGFIQMLCLRAKIQMAKTAGRWGLVWRYRLRAWGSRIKDWLLLLVVVLGLVLIPVIFLLLVAIVLSGGPVSIGVFLGVLIWKFFEKKQ